MDEHGDPEYQGPIKNRGCTDIICMLLFVACILGWVVVAGFAFVNGDTKRFAYPIESTGRRCGYDDGVKDKKYLFFFDPLKCIHSTRNSGCPTTQICVKKCPTEDIALLPPEYSENDTSWHDYCKEKTDFNINVTELVTRGDCPEFIIPSKTLLFRCVPTDVAIPDRVRVHINKMTYNGTLARSAEGRIMTPEEIVRQAASVIKIISELQEAVKDFVEDLEHSWRFILAGLVVGMVLCLIWIVLMQFLVGIITWCALLGAVVILSLGIWYSSNEYSAAKEAAKQKSEYIKIQLDESLESLFPTAETVWLIILIILSITLAVLVLFIIVLWKRIVIAIALIKETSKAVGNSPFSMVFPVYPWVVQVALIGFTTAVSVFLSTAGEARFETSWEPSCSACHDYKLNDSCTPVEFNRMCEAEKEDPSCKYECRFSAVEVPPRYNVMQYYNGFMGLWAMLFTSNFEEMVLSGTFATWYWTFHKKDLPIFPLFDSLYRTGRYHIGTLAFGSLILAAVRSFRIILEYLGKKLKSVDNSTVTQALMRCLKCYTSFLQVILQYMNTNAIIMCAVHGKNFCTSSKDAFSLLLRNALRGFALRSVTSLVLAVSKMVVVVFMVLLSLLVFQGKLNDYLTDALALHYYYIPTAVVAIGTYFISSIFFGVYATGIDTLFVCFLEDLERNDGSEQKPYFMSKDLLAVMDKKNK